MANIRYEIPEEKPQMVSKAPTDYGITIPVTVPTMGGYTFEALTRELTEFAKRLVQSKNTQATTSKSADCHAIQGKDEILIKSLSQLNPALQELCGICHVDETDLNGDVARSQILEGV